MEGLYSCKDGRRIQEAMEVGVPWKDCTGGRIAGGCRRPVMLEFLEGLGIARRIA
jgi:hypothetical protein